MYMHPNTYPTSINASNEFLISYFANNTAILQNYDFYRDLCFRTSYKVNIQNSQKSNILCKLKFGSLVLHQFYLPMS